MTVPVAPEPTWLAAADPEHAADAVSAAFTAAFDAAPDGVWAAPGRVNLIGEHLDYNGGPVLPLALPHRTLAAVAARDDDLVRVVSAADLGEEPARWEGRLADVAPGTVHGWASYVVGVLWALGQAGHRVTGVDVAIDSAVPVGAGLSSSAALESAVAVAVADLLGLATDDAGRAALAAACVRAENEIAGASTGGMDQAASLRCTADHALLLDTSDARVEQVPLALAAEGLALLVVDTRAPHTLSDGGGYADRRAASERAAQLLGLMTPTGSVLAQAGDLDAALARLDDDVLRRRARHVITETARVGEVVTLLRAQRCTEIGPVLDASHTSMRDDYQISSPELDVVVAAAQTAGALGARMTGGGFGGSAVALVNADAAHEVAAAVSAAAASAGHPAPAFLLAEASPGALRVR